jgi:hypothetical protein
MCILRTSGFSVGGEAHCNPQGRALRNELGLAFGTQKSSKVIASLTENAISPSNPAVPRGSSGNTNATL